MPPPPARCGHERPGAGGRTLARRSGGAVKPTGPRRRGSAVRGERRTHPRTRMPATHFAGRCWRRRRHRHSPTTTPPDTWRTGRRRLRRRHRHTEPPASLDEPRAHPTRSSPSARCSARRSSRAPESPSVPAQLSGRHASLCARSILCGMPNSARPPSKEAPSRFPATLVRTGSRGNGTGDELVRRLLAIQLRHPDVPASGPRRSGSSPHSSSLQSAGVTSSHGTRGSPGNGMWWTGGTLPHCVLMASAVSQTSNAYRY